MRLAAALAVLLAAGAAGAERALIADGDTRWALELPPGFERDESPPEIPDGVLLASYVAPGGRRVAVVRMRANTDAARAGDAAYFAGLEEGVKNEARRYQRISATPRKLGRTGKIPAYDLFYRTGDAVRGTRFVLLRGYALILTVHAPRARRVDRAMRTIVTRFRPT